MRCVEPRVIDETRPLYAGAGDIIFDYLSWPINVDRLMINKWLVVWPCHYVAALRSALRSSSYYPHMPIGMLGDISFTVCLFVRKIL